MESQSKETLEKQQNTIGQQKLERWLSLDSNLLLRCVFAKNRTEDFKIGREKRHFWKLDIVI